MEPNPTLPLPSARDDEPLRDEQGPIPTFPSAKVDDKGRMIHPSPEELRARRDAYRRLVKIRREQPVSDEPDDFEDFMRAMDSNRPEGMKLFEGYY